MAEDESNPWGGIATGVLDIIGNLWQSGSKNDAQNNYQQILQDREQQNYDQSKLEYDSYLDYLNQRAAQGGGSGGGSGGGGGGTLGGGVGKKLLKAYARTGKKLLKPQAKTYKNSLNSMNMLNAYLTSPASMQLMNPSTPATQVNLGPLPDYLLK